MERFISFWRHRRVVYSENAMQFEYVKGVSSLNQVHVRISISLWYIRMDLEMVDTLDDANWPTNGSLVNLQLVTSIGRNHF